MEINLSAEAREYAAACARNAYPLFILREWRYYDSPDVPTVERLTETIEGLMESALDYFQKTGKTYAPCSTGRLVVYYEGEENGARDKGNFEVALQLGWNHARKDID